MERKKTIPDYDPSILIDARRKLTLDEREEVLSLKGYIPRDRVAKLYNVSEYTIYVIWNPKRLEKVNLWKLVNGIVQRGTPEQERKKSKKYSDKQKLKNAGLL